jgi:hypothetical protein
MEFKGTWDDFPNLDKANAAKSIVDLLTETTADGKHPIAPVKDLQDKQKQQQLTDFKSFHQSQATALDRGNRNACADRAQAARIADAQSLDFQKQYQDRITPHTQPARLYGTREQQTRLPTPRPFAPVDNTKGVPRIPYARNSLNQLRTTPTRSNYAVPVVEPTQFTDKAKDNHNKFMQAHAGKRGTSIGDRAIVFSQNGTPHYGDSYLDKSLQDNLSANQAAAGKPVTSAPTNIATSTPVKAKALNRGKNGQIHPKGGAVVGMLAGAAAIAAISAIMFPLQYFIAFFSFLLNVQTATSNIRNIASSTTTFFSNIAFLMGFGEDALKPVEQNLEGMLNNVFGKDKVEYVKLQFAKLTVAVTAAVNIVDSIRDANNALATVAEASARNGARIGNALKVARIIDKGFDWMDEKISYARSKGTLAGVNRSLGTVGTVSSELTNITREIKDAVKEEEELDKQFNKAKAEREKDHTKEIAPIYTESTPPVVPTIREASV